MSLDTASFTTMIVAWTGHRPDLFADPAGAEAAVFTVARELLKNHPEASFAVGGQRGVDTWAARAAIELGLPFTLVLPLDPAEFCHDWPDADRHALETTVARAAHVRVVGGNPSHAFTERNRLLVADAHLLVAVWTGVTGGGAAETIAFASAGATPVREVRLTSSASAGQASGRGV